jgi:nitrogen regulatory protein P-II 2
MQTHAKKLLVVITEGALEKLLARDVRRLGAHGYTVSDVRGGGERGERAADWEADRSIRMEVIGDEHVVGTIADHILATYCPNYAVSMYVADCGVLRPHKF